MQTTQKKTAHYRRVVWLKSAGTKTTLEETLRTLWSNKRRTRTFQTDDGLHCQVKRSERPEFIACHFVVYEEGADAAVLEAVGAADSDVDTVPPPDNAEYVQSQLFCVLRHDHIVWICHNATMREGTITSLFNALIEDLGGDTKKTKFRLMAKLDKRALKEAFEEGIEEIDLGLGSFGPVLESLSKPTIPGIRALRSLIQGAFSVDQMDALQRVMGRLRLTPGKDWKLQNVTELLADMAEDVLDSDEEEFAIVTKGGIHLTRERMSVRKKLTVKGNRQILTSETLEQLAEFLVELGKDELLENWQ